MGIKQFKKVFEHQAECSAKYLKGKRIAVDALAELCRALLGTSSVTQLTDRNGNPTNYISVILSVISKLYLAGAMQIWVFDSPKPHPLKYVLRERSERRKNAKEKLDKLNGVQSPLVGVQLTSEWPKRDFVNVSKDSKFYIPPDAMESEEKESTKRRLEKQSIKVTAEMIANVKRILDAFRIPYVVAPDCIEAEHVAAHLTTIDKADIVFTPDPDALLFGAKRVLMRNKNNRGKDDEYILYKLDLLLERYKIDRIKLINMGIILGCDFYCDERDEDDPEDYRPYFKGIGPKTIMKKYKGVAGGLEDDKVEQARNAFLVDPPPYIIVNEECLQNKKGSRSFSNSNKINELVAWLVDTLSFNPDSLVERFRNVYGLRRIKYITQSNKQEAKPDDH